MSERGAELAAKLSRQVDEIAEFFGTLHDADLRGPCHDEAGGDAGNTVGAAAAHLAEGYHRLGQFLRSAGYVPGSPSTDDHEHDHGHGHQHTHVPQAVRVVLERLVAGKTPIGFLADLTDERLDGVPPRANRFADGHRTLQQVIDEVIAHQAAHLATLRRAVNVTVNATADTGARHQRRHQGPRRHWMILGIVLLKLAILAVVLALPSGLALSLGAAHGVILLVLLGSAAVVLAVFKLRGKPLPTLSHRLPSIPKNRGRK